MILKFVKEGKNPYKLVESYDDVNGIKDETLSMTGFGASSYYATKPLTINLSIDDNGNFSFPKDRELKMEWLDDESKQVVYIDEDRISEVTSDEALEAWTDYRNSKLNDILNLPK